MLKLLIWMGYLPRFGLFYLSHCFRETSLKIKQALPETSSYITSGAASTLRGTLKAELPNNSLYTFEGTLELNGLPERPVGPNQILLRVRLFAKAIPHLT